MSREIFRHDELSIGDRLLIYRKSKRWTAIKLSQLIKISQSSLSQLENDKTEPAAETLKKIIEHSDLNIVWLLTGRGEMLVSDAPLNNGERIERLEKQVAELSATVQRQTSASTGREQVIGIGPDGTDRRTGEDRRDRECSDNGDSA